MDEDGAIQEIYADGSPVRTIQALQAAFEAVGGVGRVTNVITALEYIAANAMPALSPGEEEQLRVVSLFTGGNYLPGDDVGTEIARQSDEISAAAFQTSLANVAAFFAVNWSGGDSLPATLAELATNMAPGSQVDVTLTELFDIMTGATPLYEYAPGDTVFGAPATFGGELDIATFLNGLDFAGSVTTNSTVTGPLNTSDALQDLRNAIEAFGFNAAFNVAPASGAAVLDANEATLAQLLSWLLGYGTNATAPA